MRYVSGILILLVFYAAGTLAHQWLHIPLPGSLLGMIMLALALVMGWIRMDWVERASSFLIRHMMLFFIPIIVGVSSYMNVVANDPLPILLSLVLGPFIVMLVTGRVVQWYVRREKSQANTELSQEGRSLDA
ncbi:CidA/LrgA family protein [Brevibacillus sp. TJ4]|uniref:CidA/LrgA family protein n=1 Tax=Brevibacillus sp. TJ4 TaxID=3234853 RepID=UPI0037CF810A